MTKAENNFQMSGRMSHNPGSVLKIFVTDSRVPRGKRPEQFSEKTNV